MLEVRNLTKMFGNFKAVDDLSFKLHPGRIYAFVGPNGAGKTTTMRMIATLEEPTSGEIYVNGMSTYEHPYEIRRLIGYMPDHYGTYPDLTIRDYLEFYARAYGLEPAIRGTRIDRIMEFTGLNKIDGKRVDTLSKGMMQRLNMGRGLLNDPKVLILDEPAAGLDPRARVELRYLMKQLAEQGKTIFVSSHILTELAEMCDEMLIIDRGRQVTFGTVEQIQGSMQEAVEISVKLVGEQEELLRFETWLLERAAVSQVSPRESMAMTFSFAGDKGQVPALLREIIEAGFPVLEFKPVMLSMEDVFMQITQSDIEQ
ncbi:MAG: ABC transporter ATP-binding protein [Candidatus Sumerlaeaceae bacterium]